MVTNNHRDKRSYKHKPLQTTPHRLLPGDQDCYYIYFVNMMKENSEIKTYIYSCYYV